jgi:hypothetical protein
MTSIAFPIRLTARQTQVEVQKLAWLYTMGDTSIAQKNWELENDITTVNPDQDSLYFYDADQQRTIGSEQPWKSE